jgi:hypothetical protein
MDNLETAEKIFKDDFADISGSGYRIVQSPEWLMQSKHGCCWEQTELARRLFDKQNIPCKTYFMDYVYNDNMHTQTHTFLVFQDGGKFYWFEHSWIDQNGIHCYDSLKELLLDVIAKLKYSAKLEGFKKCENFRIRKYDAPKLPAPHMEVFYHFLNGQEIKIEDL